MAFERKWAAVAPVAFTQDGSSLGLVTVADAAGFYVKQSVLLFSLTQPQRQLQVKWVLSPTQLIVGLVDNKVGRNFGADISAYTVAQNAQIAAPEQDKNNIPDKDHYNAVYEADPIVADRVILVDQYGNFYAKDENPLPISFDGTVNVGDVEIKGSNGNILQPNPDGSLNVVLDNLGATTSIVNVYAEAAAVAAQTSATVLTYVVPSSAAAANLQRVSVSGDNLARFDVKLNGSIIDTRRTYWGNLNEEFNFMTDQAGGGFSLKPGDTVTVSVLNTSPSNSSADFEARIQTSLQS